MKNNKFFLLIVIIVIQFNLYSGQFKLGIENIPPSSIKEWKNLRIGLVTNQTGIDQSGRSNIDLFKEKGIPIKALFAPEHGIAGLVKAGHEVKNEKNPKLSIPIYSLYKNEQEGKKIDGDLLKGIDIVFFDIQDSGMRHYTYISTLYNLLEAAALYNKKIVVFDRPNPLGIIMEGPSVDPDLRSFISIAEIPLRHGLTIAELAEYFNNFILKKKALLTTIAMKNYERNMVVDKFQAPLSPNITSPSSCFGYSFLGLLGEIKPFEVGVGTEHAFQLLLLPESFNISERIWKELAHNLKDFGLHTQLHEMLHPHKNQRFKGLRMISGNINQVLAFNALLLVVCHMKKAGIELNFSDSFDKAVGSHKVRSYLLGLIPYQELTNDINGKLQEFFLKAQTVFKYYPKPELNFI